MKIVLILLAVILVVGFFFGWFHFSSHNGQGSSTAGVTLTVDKDKMEADKDKVVDKVQDVRHSVKDAVTSIPTKDSD